MERSREYEEVAAALATVRPAPRPDFAAELDERVNAGFPRQPRTGRSPLPGLAARLRRPSLRSSILAGGATALAAVAIATAIVTSTDSDPRPVAVRPQHTATPPRSTELSAKPSQGSAGSAQGSGGSGQSSAGESGEALLDFAAPATSTALVPAGAGAAHRDIERSAEIGLFADPGDVAEDSAKVFSAVHDANGIVLHSTTTQGRNGGADFDLLIPSARLGDALAAFSAIDEVRTRHEATADITAPTVTTGEQLRDSRAKIDGLLAQLAAAETESEASAVEAVLRAERRRAAQLSTRLARLHRRTDFSRVSVRIETGATPGSSGGSWGIDDALGDAGHILSVALGVTVVGLAALVPLALAVLLALFAHRTWLRRARDRALA
jgi:hypothetical protein